jgi:hypothetical protein
MTLHSWIEIAMNVVALAALVCAVVAALILPLRRHGERPFGDGRFRERGSICPRTHIAPSG